MGKDLFGTFSRSLDSKGRLLLPKKLGIRKGERLYFVRGFDGCLSVYPNSEFKDLIAKLEGKDFFNSEDRALIRIAASSVSEARLDDHGRILITKELVEDFNLKDEVKIIGVIDHFEIWEEKAYKAYINEHAPSYGQSSAIWRS